MMFMSTEIINSWRPVCVRWQEPVPSSSARVSVLSLSVGDWEGVLLWLFASLLYPCSRTTPPDTSLWKQQPPLTGLQSIHPSPAFTCVDMQHTRKSLAAAGIQHRCSVWDLISNFLSQKVQVWMNVSVAIELVVWKGSAFVLINIALHWGSCRHPWVYILEFFSV